MFDEWILSKSKIMKKNPSEHISTHLALSVAPPYFLPLKAVASNLAKIGGNYLVGGHFWGHEDGWL